MLHQEAMASLQILVYLLLVCIASVNSQTRGRGMRHYDLKTGIHPISPSRNLEDTKLYRQTGTRFTASFPGQDGTRKVKTFRILMKQEMIGWQWHWLDHMRIICTTLQTDNHASKSSLDILQAGCSFWHPTNSVKALKAKRYKTSGYATWFTAGGVQSASLIITSLMTS